MPCPDRDAKGAAQLDRPPMSGQNTVQGETVTPRNKHTQPRRVLGGFLPSRRVPPLGRLWGRSGGGPPLPLHSQMGPPPAFPVRA